MINGKRPVPTHIRSVVALMAGATCIGFAPLFVRFALLEGVGPTAAAFWRFVISLPFLWAWSALEGSGRAKVSSRQLYIIVACGILFTCDFSVWHRAIAYTTVANATFLANLAPIFVTLGAWLFFKDKIRGIFLLGMALAILGMGMLMSGSVVVGGTGFRGDILAVTTALFYGGYQLTVKKLRASWSTGFILSRTHSIAALGLLLVTVLSGEELLGYSGRAWLILFGLALVSHVLGQGLIAWSLARLSAPFASVGLIWQPAMAALLAWWWLAESMGSLQIIGCLVIIVGISIAHRGSGKARQIFNKNTK
jgi:drug/metabolite transporter (DMT)-like permease